MRKACRALCPPPVFTCLLSCPPTSRTQEWLPGGGHLCVSPLLWTPVPFQKLKYAQLIKSGFFEITFSLPRSTPDCVACILFLSFSSQFKSFCLFHRLHGYLLFIPKILIFLIKNMHLATDQEVKNLGRVRLSSAPFSLFFLSSPEANSVPFLLLVFFLGPQMISTILFSGLTSFRLQT